MALVIIAVGFGATYGLITYGGEISSLLVKCSLFAVFAIWCKAIMGFQFSWETCDCCGLKIRDHDAPEKREKRAKRWLAEKKNKEEGC